MENPIEKLLAELVFKVADHFNLDAQEALAVVAQSKLANELSRNGNCYNLTLNQLSEKLYDEIAKAE
ncbi:MAG: hypothetical protein K2K26_05190 [Muribaculaceae bacterium]|nr:hypothetical protein [Muribaculaceae bacterium]